MKKISDMSEAVVKSIVDSMEYDSIEDAKDQLDALSELGVLYQEELDAVLAQLKDKEQGETIGDIDTAEIISKDEIIKDVEDYPIEVESNKKKAGEIFTCDKCGETFSIGNLGIYAPENILIGGDSTERIELCKECLNKFIQESTQKEGGIYTELWQTPKGQWWFLSIANMSKVSPLFETKDEALNWGIEGGLITVDEADILGKKTEPDGIAFPEDIFKGKFTAIRKKSRIEIDNDYSVEIVRRKEGYYLRYEEKEIGPFKNAALSKTAIVQKCKEKDKDTAEDIWCVYAESGKLMGRYKTKEEAEKRLSQIEYWKHQKN